MSGIINNIILIIIINIILTLKKWIKHDVVEKNFIILVVHFIKMI